MLASERELGQDGMPTGWQGGCGGRRVQVQINDPDPGGGGRSPKMTENLVLEEGCLLIPGRAE